MKTPKIANAIGHLDDDLITEATQAKTRKRTALIKWGALAACFAIMLMATAILAPRIFEKDPTPPSANGIDSKKYYDYGINEGAFSSYIGGNIITKDKIGSKIESVAVTAGWKNEEGEWLSVETLAAEVYTIEGVQNSVAAALKFIDKGENLSTERYYVILHPNAEYNGMLFPDYKTENPVRYLEESSMGKCNGWQDFGLSGEIRTVAVPIGSTYIYQMYAYYIRNDLSHIYAKEELPHQLTDLPEWLTDTASVGRRSFWYSMGYRLPTNITLDAENEITAENGSMNFVRAEYTVQIKDGANEKEEKWVVYFMEEDGVYSAFAVIANENFDFVKSYSESIVRSYQKK